MGVELEASLEEGFEKKSALDDQDDALVPEDEGQDLDEKVERFSVLDENIEEVKEPSDSDGQAKENVPLLIEDEKGDQLDLENTEKNRPYPIIIKVKSPDQEENSGSFSSAF